MEIVEKSSLRTNIARVTKKIPLLHRSLILVYHFTIFEILPRIRVLVDKSSRKSNLSSELTDFLSMQSIRSLTLNLVTPSTDEDLVNALNKAHVPFSEGGWTVYLPPSDKLYKVIPEIVDYPPNSGVKILRHLQPPETACYTLNDLRPTPGAGGLRLRTPDPKTLLRIAGTLFAQGVGPLVHDLVELKVGGAKCTAFITDHVEPQCEVTEKEYLGFITKLKSVLNDGILSISHGDYRYSKDFRAPDCNGNLLKNTDGRVLYVDFQSFNFQNEKEAFLDWSRQNGKDILFGPRRAGKQESYLYQMIPGVGDAKRETMHRWEVLDNLTEEAGLCLKDRITFDIGCNAGLMSYYALSRGAKWAYGWDQINVATASQKLLRLLGATRWNAFGMAIQSDTNFCTSLPTTLTIEKSGVLLFLAISNHIGLPKGVADLPWKYCIYEGHSNQSVGWSIEKIKTSGWGKDITILSTGTIRDGDSPTRSVIIFSR